MLWNGALLACLQTSTGMHSCYFGKIDRQQKWQAKLNWFIFPSSFQKLFVSSINRCNRLINDYCEIDILRLAKITQNVTSLVFLLSRQKLLANWKISNILKHSPLCWINVTFWKYPGFRGHCDIVQIYLAVLARSNIGKLPRDINHGQIVVAKMKMLYIFPINSLHFTKYMRA